MTVYDGERSCLDLYDGIECIDDVIERLEDQLDEFRRMKAAGVDAYSASDEWDEDGVHWLKAQDPQTVEEFGFWEAGEWELDEATGIYHVSDESGRPLCESEEPSA